MYNPAVDFGNILLSITFSINSITITSFFIQVIWFFCIKNKSIDWLLFSWALPTPGLRNKAGFFWQYYQCRRNKVFVRVARVWTWPPWLFPFINAVSAVPRTTRSADLIPDPIHGISASIFLWYFHWPDRASSPGTGRLETHFLSLSLSGTGGSVLLWYWWST